MKPGISIIAGIGKNRELGKGTHLVWRIRDDLQRVKALTMGHPLIMGRKTYESIGKPLPGRTMIVISRTETEIPGCVVVHSLEDALAHARGIDREEIFLFGGAQIYEQGLPFADRLYLTLIDAEDRDADTFFPAFADTFTKKVSEESREQEGLHYTWVTLERT